MPNEIKPKTLAEMGVQTAPNPGSAAEARGRYFNSGNAFNLILDPVPDMVFTEEPAAALADGAQTGFYPCDAAKLMGDAGTATTPLLLARYVRVNAGEALDATFPATGSIWYVIQGSGTAAIAGETIEWAACDVFILPGGDTVALTAGDADAVLWSVTNEPHISFESTRPVEVDDSTVDIVHFPAAEIDRQIGMLYEVEQSDAAGIALVFSSEKQFARRNITPTMTLAMNTLPPGDTQPAHRHNSVAVTLVVQGEGCYSTVDGRRKPWAPWVTTITPPVSVHSHTNGGDKLAKFLIVQDGGLYYHARTMGFSFDLFTPEA